MLKLTKKTILTTLLLVSLLYPKPLVFVKDNINNFLQVASSISKCSIVNDFELNWDISVNMESPTKSELFSVIRYSLNSHGYILKQIGDCKYRVEVIDSGDITKTIKVENPKEWIDVISQNAFLIKKKYGRDVYISHTNNAISIVGSPEDVNFLSSLIDDSKNQKEIVIELKIYEMYSSKIKDVGVSYNLIKSFQSPETVLNSLLNISGNLISQSSTFQMYKDIGNNVIFGGILNFLEGENSLKVVNSAILEVKSNESANIKDGTQLSIQDKVDRYGQKSYTKTNIGLNLKIEPLVLENDMVFISIELSDSSIMRYDSNNNPVLKIKELETAVKAKHGKEIVLGSTYKSLITLNDNGLYGLSSIPVIGKLFKQSKSDHQDSTLLITITPYIVNESDEGKVRDFIYFKSGLKDKLAYMIKHSLNVNDKRVKESKTVIEEDQSLDWFFSN